MDPFDIRLRVGTEQPLRQIQLHADPEFQCERRHEISDSRFSPSSQPLSLAFRQVVLNLSTQAC